jgi:hypothetical protein
MARSGEMKCGEPSTMPGVVSCTSVGIRATPKSVSTHRPSEQISTLAGLTSRCSTPAAWATSSAPSSAMPIFATARGATGPSSITMSARLRASSSSITIHGRPPSVTTS